MWTKTFLTMCNPSAKREASTVRNGGPLVVPILPLAIQWRRDDSVYEKP